MTRSSPKLITLMIDDEFLFNILKKYDSKVMFSFANCMLIGGTLLTNPLAPSTEEGQCQGTMVEERKRGRRMTCSHDMTVPSLRPLNMGSLTGIEEKGRGKTKD